MSNTQHPFNASNTKEPKSNNSYLTGLTERVKATQRKIELLSTVSGREMQLSVNTVINSVAIKASSHYHISQLHSLNKL